MRLLVLTMVGAVAVIPGGLAQTASPLKIVIIDGDEAANVVQEKIAAEPVIEVRDGDDRKVAGAVVRFKIQRMLRNRLPAAFRNGKDELRTLTDAAGRARADALTPLEPGRFDIEVQVSHRGQSASTTIRHTNFSTAAQARSAGRQPGESSGTPGGAPAAATAGAGAAAAAASAATTSSGAAIAHGGGIGAGKLAAIGLVAGGAGVGTALALNRGGGSSPAPAGAITALTSSAQAGIQGATAFTFSAQTTGFDTGSLAYRWEFGDGAAATEASPTHVYQAPGPYAVVATVSDARQSVQSRTSVTVISLDGTWTWTANTANGPLQFTLQLSQSGGTIAGLEAVDVYSQCNTTGTAQSGTPAVVLNVPRCPNPIYLPHAEHDYRLDVGADGQTLRGTMTYPSVGSSFTVVMRR